ncbi:MAG: ABC transporter permease [Saprospiraceae bacterium]|nr:ABC transporter permease [Saprospiraceae bacterium]
MLLSLAWRNIWRNKRRTLITAASVLFAVLFSSVMQSIQRGTWDHMVDNVVNYYYGYIQVQGKKFWDDRSIDEVIDRQTLLEQVPDRIKEDYPLVPRLESFALASGGNRTQGALMIGIDAAKEDQLTGLKGRISQGDYWESSPEGILVGEGLAQNFKIGVGDTLIFLSQGYHGVNAVGEYPVRGLIHFASPDLSKTMVYLHLTDAQQFYGTGDQVTSVVVGLKDKDEVSTLVNTLRSDLDTSQYAVKDWQQMMPELMQAKEMDTASANVILIILYIIISFGILGTILMMTKDRQYELGVLLSIGMRRMQLFGMMWMEVIMIGMLGVGLGFLISVPLVKYLSLHPFQMSGEYAQAYEKFGAEPIIPPAFDWGIFSWQVLFVFIITSLLALYPFWVIRKMRPVEAMRQ